MNWSSVFYVVGALLMVWLAFRIIRNNPHAFSKRNLSKSIYTLGILTLLIVGVVALCVMILRS